MYMYTIIIGKYILLYLIHCKKILMLEIHAETCCTQCKLAYKICILQCYTDALSHLYRHDVHVRRDSQHLTPLQDQVTLYVCPPTRPLNRDHPPKQQSLNAWINDNVL